MAAIVETVSRPIHSSHVHFFIVRVCGQSSPAFSPEKMEAALISACKETLNSKHVTGVMALDKDGLCLYSEGFNEQMGGVISSIVREAMELDGGKTNPLTIEIGTEKGRLLVYTQKHITTAIFKTC